MQYVPSDALDAGQVRKSSARATDDYQLLGFSVSSNKCIYHMAIIHLQSTSQARDTKGERDTGLMRQARTGTQMKQWQAGRHQFLQTGRSSAESGFRKWILLA